MPATQILPWPLVKRAPQRAFPVRPLQQLLCARATTPSSSTALSGRITRVSNPDEGEVGELNRVEVRDNGEGGNAPPDQVSTIPANPGDLDPTTCVDPPTNATIRTVQRGNVQVRS